MKRPEEMHATPEFLPLVQASEVAPSKFIGHGMPLAEWKEDEWMTGVETAFDHVQLSELVTPFERLNQATRETMGVILRQLYEGMLEFNRTFAHDVQTQSRRGRNNRSELPSIWLANDQFIREKSQGGYSGDILYTTDGRLYINAERLIRLTQSVDEDDNTYLSYGSRLKTGAQVETEYTTELGHLMLLGIWAAASHKFYDAYDGGSTCKDLPLCASLEEYDAQGKQMLVLLSQTYYALDFINTYEKDPGNAAAVKRGEYLAMNDETVELFKGRIDHAWPHVEPKYQQAFGKLYTDVMEAYKKRYPSGMSEE